MCDEFGHLVRDFPRCVFGSSQYRSQLQLSPTLVFVVRGVTQSSRGGSQVARVGD